MNMRLIFRMLLLPALLFSQANTWVSAPVRNQDSLFRYGGALVYLPDSDRFLISMGCMFGGSQRPYSEQVMSLKDTIWKNFFPAGKLGVWGDTTGPSDSLIWNPYFRIEMHNGIVRPSLDHWSDGVAYHQYAYDTLQKKIYYYVQNKTFSYDPRTRAWEVLAPLSDPAGGAAGTGLRWGALCYDPVNQEILLFGGGCVDAKKGHAGTWTYKPSSNTWTKLNPSVEPAPRANSPLVYDAKNRVIVLFSGDHMDSLLGDTWIYQCASKTWVRKHPAVSPMPRAGHALLYLPRSQTVVMISGYDYHFDVQDLWHDAVEYDIPDSLEMWTYDVADGAEGSWTLIRRFPSPAPYSAFLGGNPYPSMAACDTADRIVFISEQPGGSGYRFEGLTFVASCDPSQVDAAGTVTYGWKTDSSRTRINRWDPRYLRRNEGTIDTAAQETILRNLAANAITFVSQPAYPLAGRSYGKAAIASDRGIIFHWGGGHAEVSMNDVPEFHIGKNRWYTGYAPETGFDFCGSNGGGPPGPVTFNGRPFMVTHAYDCYDYCPILKKMLLLHHRYTFLYDPDRMDWDTLFIPHHAAMRGDNYHRALNASPHGMVAWTQTASGFGLWLLDTLALQWKVLPIKNSEPVPSNYCEQAAMVFDDKRDRMLFTNVLNGSYGQLWEYRFADSSLNKLNPADSGLVRSVGRVRECVYLPGADQVLFQDAVTAQGTQGLMLYDCAENRWKCAPVTTAGSRTLDWATSSNSRPFLYDEKRGLVWIVSYENLTYAMKYQDQSIPVAAEGNRAVAAPLLQVFPNPMGTRSTLRIDFGGLPAGEAFLALFNVAGKQVAARRIQALKDKTIVLDWKALPAGVYLLRLKAGNIDLTKKILFIN